MVALLKQPFICLANHYVGLWPDVFAFGKALVFMLVSLRWNWHCEIHQGQVSKGAIGCVVIEQFFCLLFFLLFESFSSLFWTQTLCGLTVFHASVQKQSKQTMVLITNENLARG